MEATRSAQRVVPAVPRRLSVAEKARLVAEILAAWFRARRALGTTDVRSVLRSLRGEPAPRGPEPLDPQTYGEALRLAAVVGRVCRPLPFDTRCLTQSLVLTSLLARRDIGSSLVIGVRNEDAFGAHAWVELDGRPLLPTGGGAFERLVEL